MRRSESRRILFAFVPLATMLVAGCAAFRAQHSDEMYSAAAPAPSSAGADGGAAFSRIQKEIFTPKCAIPDCHVGVPPGSDEGPPEGLVLEEGVAHASIVGVRAKQRDLFRVKPGDPAESYLLRKVTPGAEISWHRMPLDRPSLSDSERQLIKDWIASGAPNN